MKNLFFKILYIIGTSGILFTFSERFFWGFWRPTIDTGKGILVGIFFYTLMAYAVLYLIDRYKITTSNGLFIVALFYAYLAEGVIACELWSPRWLLVILIALPWHALITIMIGWYYLPRFLNSAPLSKKFLAFSLSGAVFAFWSIGWLLLPGGELLTLPNFIAHAFGTIILITISYSLTLWAKQKTAITFNRYEGLLLVVAFTALHYGMLLALGRLPTIIYTLPIGFVVLALTLFVLQKNELPWADATGYQMQSRGLHHSNSAAVCPTSSFPWFSI